MLKKMTLAPFMGRMLGSWVLALGAAHAQTSPPVSPASASMVCPAVGEANTTDLLGTWQAQWMAKEPLSTTDAAWPTPPQLVLQPHPEWAGNVKGQVQHGEQATLVVGDVNEGEVTLEESEDGRRISATWVGEVVDGHCAQLIRGAYFTDAHPDGIPFTLQKISR